MLTYHLQERLIEVPPGCQIVLPNDVRMKLRLTPGVPFGGEAGPSRNAVGDTDMLLKMNASTGRWSMVRKDGPLFDPINVNATFDNLNVTVQGSEIVAESHCSTLDEIDRLASTFVYLYPAILNVYIPDPTYCTHVQGEVSGIHRRTIQKRS